MLAQHFFLKLHILFLNLAPVSTFELCNLWNLWTLLNLIISSCSAITSCPVCTKHHAALVSMMLHMYLFCFISYIISYSISISIFYYHRRFPPHTQSHPHSPFYTLHMHDCFQVREFTKCFKTLQHSLPPPTGSEK